MKKALCSLLLLCLLLPSVTVSAATVTATEQELRTLLQNSTRLKEISEVLQLNSTESQRELARALEELRISKEELAALKQELTKLKDDLARATALSRNQEDLIRKTNVLFEQYSREMKAKVKRAEINGWVKALAGIGVGYFAARIASH